MMDHALHVCKCSMPVQLEHRYSAFLARYRSRSPDSMLCLTRGRGPGEPRYSENVR